MCIICAYICGPQDHRNGGGRLHGDGHLHVYSGEYDIHFDYYTEVHVHLFHVAIETKTSKPNNSASTDRPMT